MINNFFLSSYILLVTLIELYYPLIFGISLNVEVVHLWSNNGIESTKGFANLSLLRPRISTNPFLRVRQPLYSSVVFFFSHVTWHGGSLIQMRIFFNVATTSTFQLVPFYYMCVCVWYMRTSWMMSLQMNVIIRIETNELVAKILSIWTRFCGFGFFSMVNSLLSVLIEYAE